VGVTEDPLLTATVTGWTNGDDENTASYVISNGVVTWTYTRTPGEGEEPVTLLTFTLTRAEGEEEGDYQITAAGQEEQPNYKVYYEMGENFGILSVLDVDVSQPLVDHADYGANPVYQYTATLDLSGTGLDSYFKNGFEDVNGVPTMVFTLPEGTEALKTLKVPGGAALTIEQNTPNADYTTDVRIDGNPNPNTENPLRVSILVNTFHGVTFTHSRISLPVEARAAVGQTEAGAETLPGRKGAMGIPDGIRAINGDFADEMNSRIGYTLPSDRYYLYDHASLYNSSDGSAVPGASGVTAIRYDGGT
jgi:hypothetical protein